MSIPYWEGSQGCGLGPWPGNCRDSVASQRARFSVCVAELWETQLASSEVTEARTHSFTSWRLCIEVSQGSGGTVCQGTVQAQIPAYRQTAEGSILPHSPYSTPAAGSPPPPSIHSEGQLPSLVCTAVGPISSPSRTALLCGGLRVGTFHSCSLIAARRPTHTGATDDRLPAKAVVPRAGSTQAWTQA